MKTNCKVLVISNECFSNGSSNGRTLRNFLLGWPKENIAQFYIKTSEPDYSICNNYYHVTDAQAFRALFGKKLNGTNIKQPIENNKNDPNISNVDHLAGSNPNRRNAFTMYIRDMVWESNCWMGKFFYNWVEEFAPDVVLLQAGDNGFTLKLARNLSVKYKIPLVIYNSENFYFKSYDYFRAKGIGHAFYPFYRKHYHRQFEAAMKRANKTIYICEMLQNDYDNVFGKPSETIYTATEMKPRINAPDNSFFKASYLGNFGVGRYEPLIDIANTLHDLSPHYYLDIYGRISDTSIKETFDNCEGIRYKGFVSYNECVKIMHESDLLVHGENFLPFFREGLKRAFSTKIADSLASGTCFLLYAPSEIACAQYLIGNKAAYVVSSKEELKRTMTRLISDPKAREIYLANARSLVERNHSAQKNAERFQQVILEEYNKGVLND